MFDFCPHNSSTRFSAHQLSCEFQLHCTAMILRAMVVVMVVACSQSVLGQIRVLPKRDAGLKQVVDDKFHVGDVWQYKTRREETRSRLTIVRVDKSPELGVIVHIAVDGVQLYDCYLGGRQTTLIAHMPFAKKALEASVVKRTATLTDLPRFEDGYRDWSEAYARKKAGIYVIPVARAVNVVERTFRDGIGCGKGQSMSSLGSTTPVEIKDAHPIGRASR